MAPGKAGPEKVAGGLSSGCNFCPIGVQKKERE